MVDVEESVPRIDDEVLTTLRVGVAVSGAKEKALATHESLDDVVVDVSTFPFVVGVEKIDFKNVFCFSEDNTVNVTIHRFLLSKYDIYMEERHFFFFH